MKKIIIGTRGSRLSQIQTRIVKDQLQALLPQTTIEITTITTSGDKNLSPIPLDTVGKGWFTKEIDKQLLEGKIDLAVHSLKDLLDTLTPGLVIAAIPKREDPAEALVSRNNIPFEKLKIGAIIGTDSLRRKIQILKMNPYLLVKSVRGNVGTRLEKLDAGEYDGLVLAVAGLKRLGLEKRITQYFDSHEFIPSPGQGALAVVTREKDTLLNKIVSKLNHASSVTAVSCERTFSNVLGGGCSMPVGAYAKRKGKILMLFGMYGSEDGKHLIKESIRGSVDDPKGLAQTLAKKILLQANAWKNTTNTKYVVLTREAKVNKEFAMLLDPLGLLPLLCPSINTKKNLSKKTFQTYLADLKSYQWIIFTSGNGVRYFIEGLRECSKYVFSLEGIAIAVVGEKTARIAKEYGLSVTLVPQTFTAENLVKSLLTIRNKKILLPRSTIGDKDVKTELEKKGALVTDMPVYKTEHAKFQKDNLKKLLTTNQILCITFTSPSAVHGFLKNIQKPLQQKLLSLPVLSIGPTTTRAAKLCGFTRIYTAKIHTTEGMFTKLKESIL